MVFNSLKQSFNLFGVFGPNYTFQANVKSPQPKCLKHLKQLQAEHGYLFEDIPSIEDLAGNYEAVNVMTAACKTIALASAAYDESLKPGGKPFFLALGEVHNVPDHTIHQMLVLEGLKKLEIPFELSIENPPRTAKSIIEKHSAFTSDLTESSYLPSGQVAPEILLSSKVLDDFSGAPYTQSIILPSFLSELHKNGISIKDTDTSKYASDYINSNDDPLASSIIYSTPFQKRWNTELTLSMSGNTNFLLHPRAGDGMALRNEYAIEKLTHQNKQPKQNVVHIGGSAHIKGTKNNDTTIIAFAENAGYNPIGRYIETDEFKCDRLCKKIRLNNVRHFEHKTQIEINDNYKYEDFFESEMKYVNPILKLLGLGRLTVPDYTAVIAINKEHARILARYTIDLYLENLDKQPDVMHPVPEIQ